MLAVVARRRGLGRLGADPGFWGSFSPFTSGACGFTDLGVFKPECWAIDLGPGVVGQNKYQAALALQNPDVAYPPMPLPAPPPAVTNSGVSPTSAPTVDQANQAIQSAIEQSAATTQQQNLDYFNQVASGLDQLAAGGGGGSSSVGVVVAIAAVGLAIVLLAR